MNTEAIKIFQIYYRVDQLSEIDAAFEPLDNTGTVDPFLEYGVFKRIHESSAQAEARLWGAVSWKFKQKTGLSGANLLGILESNPGFDVYYCNPSADIEGLFQNMWMHGQTTHPGFLDLVKDVFKEAGLDASVCSKLLPGRAFASANYMIGTPAFWSAYLRFVDRIMQPALANPSLRDRLLSLRADPRAVHFGACYVPFVVERLFGMFIDSEEGRALKAYKYALPEVEAKLSPHVRLLREMREAAYLSRSAWLAGCWLGYRSMFFQNTRGKEWAKEHLPQITPPTIEFGEFRPVAP